MAETFVEVKGLKELDRQLKKLEPKLAKKVMRKAVSAGAEVIRKEARQLAARFSSFVSRNIIKSIKRKKSVVIARIGPSKKAFIGLFFEFGTFGSRTEPLVQPRKPKAAKAFAGGARGTRMQPFMRPAFATKGRRAISVMREKIASELKRLVRA